MFLLFIMDINGALLKNLIYISLPLGASSAYPLQPRTFPP